MALQVWMPLIKQELTQQGLSSGTLSGTPNWGQGGKISERCFRCDGPIITTIDGLKNVTTFSIAYWLYVDSSISTFTNYADFFELQATSGNTTTVIRDELRANTANLGRHAFHMIKDASVGSNTNTYYGLGERDDAKDKWCHVVVTKDANYCDAYADGVRYAHVACSNFESSPCKLTGAMQLGMTGCTSGYLQDFRVYDHVLSQMEIKELSKGLVLHYPLNRGGWGQENLYHYSKDFSNWTFYSGTTTTTDNGEIVITYPNTADVWPGAIANRTILYSKVRNKTITVSADLKADSGVSCGFDPCLLLTASETSLSRLKYKDNTYNFTGTGEWIHWSATYNITDALFSSGSGSPDYTNCYFSITFYRRATPTGSFKLKNPKVELGSVATPWCPNSSDALATTMGLNGTTEYDCSGFCNNGIRTGTFEWTSDTPKYSVSTEFNNSNYINIGTQLYGVKDEVTVNLWVYKSNWSVASGTPFSCVEGGGYGWQVNGTNLQVLCGTGTTSNSYWSVTLTTNNLSAGWHMFTLTYNGMVCKAYIDAIEKNSTTKYTTKTPIYYNNNSAMFIGGESSGNLTAPSSGLWTGKISDVRIYATALSADDVKSLYQNSAYIDSDGNIYGAVHSEV